MNHYKSLPALSRLGEQKRSNAQYKLASDSAEWVWLIDIDDHYRMCRQILCKHDREDGAAVGDAIL